MYRVYWLAMSKPRSNGVTTRNVRLDIGTYERLDRYALELANERGSRKVTLNDATAALLDAHDKARSKK
jgi:hypothetical protein